MSIIKKKKILEGIVVFFFWALFFFAFYYFCGYLSSPGMGISDYQYYYIIHERLSNGESVFKVFCDLSIAQLGFLFRNAYYIEPVIAVKLFGLDWSAHFLFRGVLCAASGAFIYLFSREMGGGVMFSTIAPGIVFFGSRGELLYNLCDERDFALLICSAMLFAMAFLCTSGGKYSRLVFVVLLFCTLLSYEDFYAQMPVYLFLYLFLHYEFNEGSFLKSIKENQVLIITSIVAVSAIAIYISFFLGVDGGKFGGGLVLDPEAIINHLFGTLSFYRTLCALTFIGIIMTVVYSLATNKESLKEYFIYIGITVASCMINIMIHLKNENYGRYQVVLLMAVAFMSCITFDCYFKARLIKMIYCICMLIILIGFTKDSFAMGRRWCEGRVENQGFITTLSELIENDDSVWIMDIDDKGGSDWSSALQVIFKDQFGYDKCYKDYGGELIDIIGIKEEPIVELGGDWEDSDSSMVYRLFDIFSSEASIKDYSDADVIIIPWQRLEEGHYIPILEELSGYSKYVIKLGDNESIIYKK